METKMLPTWRVDFSNYFSEKSKKKVNKGDLEPHSVWIPGLDKHRCFMIIFFHFSP